MEEKTGGAGVGWRFGDVEMTRILYTPATLLTTTRNWLTALLLSQDLYTPEFSSVGHEGNALAKRKMTD